MSNIGKTYKCSICNSPDHTKRNHDKSLIVSDAGADMATEHGITVVRKCSHCNTPGHYARTCPQLKSDTAQNDRDMAYVAYLGYVRHFTADSVAMRNSKSGIAAQIMGRPTNVQLFGVGVY